MAHIKKNTLVDTATIYNVWIDPATGKPRYFRSFLGAVRLMDKSSKVNVAAIGWTQVVTQQMLADAQNTIAYSRDDSGNQITKIYAAPDEWSALSVSEKEAYWTMQGGDYVLPGECSVLIPPDLITALTALKPRKISSILTVRQKGGSLNHWEVALV